MFSIKNVFASVNGVGSELSLYDAEKEEYVLYRKAIKINADKGIVRVFAKNCSNSPYGYQYCFAENNGLSVEIEVDARNALGCEVYSPFWSRPAFAKQNLSELPSNLRGVLIQTKSVYLFILPICNNELYCTLSGGNSENTIMINIGKRCGGYSEICGVCAVCAESENPYDAVRKAYVKAVENKLIDTPLREEKQYPQMFEYLGWCSWNAFYHDVDENLVLQKAQEFQDKGVPVKWFMIDDGWSKCNDFKLTSLEADEQKFSTGFSCLADRLKNEYKIEHLGIWHSLTGYWFGIDENSKLYKTHREWFFETNLGVYMPKPEYVSDFFAKWYEYLKKEKIDFLKIDCQGNLTEFFKGIPNSCAAVRTYQKSADSTAHEYFGNNVIACMGLDSINCQSRPFTPIVRNSDDYFPDIEGSFRNHANMNAYNAVFNRDLYYCDFDMWWTNHETVVESAMLRAISGGPIYISDKLGDTMCDVLLSLVDNEGKILRCDDCARVTEDCLFTDTIKEGKALKLFNTKENNGVVALFNLTENDILASTGKRDFGADGRYVAYAYTTKKFYDGDNIRITLKPGKSEIINFYEIQNGAVELGDLSKYISIADENKETIRLENIAIAPGELSH